MGTQREVDTVKVKVCEMGSIANLIMNKPWIQIFSCNFFRRMNELHAYF
jgi:hypothetical protein